MPNEPGGSFRPFPATQWSLIDRAAGSNDAVRQPALAALLQRYLPALRAHLVGDRGIAADRADDLLQGFVADKIIEQDLLAQAQRERGKFRSFLLTTLDRYVISLHRSESALKRRPAGGLVELDDVAHAIASGDSPAERFNLVWARELIAEALRRMRAECEAGGRKDIWTVFDARVVRPCFEGQPPVEYAVLVEQLALKMPMDACRLLATGKRMFSRNLRAVATEYTSGDDGSVEEEIAELRRILAQCSAQPGKALRS